MPLEYEISAPSAPRDGSTVIVLLHGRGSDRFNLLNLRDAFAADTILVTPEALFPGADWGYGGGWAWYRYLGEDRPDPETFERSQEELAEFMSRLPSILPAAPGEIVLGGFSQGGTMSLAHALMYPGTVRHVLNFSGFLANERRVRVTPETLRGVRIFWGHGTHDPAIPFAMAEAGRAKLAAAGADLASRTYSIGHWIDPRELDDAVKWLEVGPGSVSSGDLQ